MKRRVTVLIISLILIFISAFILAYDITQSYNNTVNIDTKIVETIPIAEDIEESQWWTDEELDMLAAVIYYEAGSNSCSDRLQQLVGQVVMNRVHSLEFPRTIYEVVTQQKPAIQYSTYKNVLNNMGNRDIIPQRCYDNALVVLNEGVECPNTVVFQANFPQGSKIYETHKTPYSTVYFCYR